MSMHLCRISKSLKRCFVSVASASRRSHRWSSSAGARSETLLRMERLEDRIVLSSLPAFPGAEGYGMFVTGGRGGSVYEVTTLADSGAGSLRDAVSQSNCTVVFRVSGTIELGSNLLVSGDNLTIAGQTAPGGGITLKNYGMRLDGADNVIIRYLRVRPGDTGSDTQVDGIGFTNYGASNVIFDHVSASWGIDETFSFYGLPNVTIQWSIISEGLMVSNHPKGPHSMGGIQNGWDTSLHHNLYISNNARNPKFNIADWWPGQNTDFRNNVVYNWGDAATHGGNGGLTLTNVVNNYYKYGPSTDSGERSAFLAFEGGSPGEWYVDGNYVYGYPSITADNWSGIVSASNGIRGDVPFSSAPVTTESAQDAYNLVLQHAGANVPHRDVVDTRLVNDVANGTGAIIDSPSEVGGWPSLPSTSPPTDSDLDGMPDSWETTQGLDPGDAADHNGVTLSGYTNLEVYLNSLVPTLGSLASPGQAAQAFWPFPADGNTQEDASVQLRWKAGFNTASERVYFGTSPSLTEADFKEEKVVTRSVSNKQLITSSVCTPGQLQNGTTYYWRIDSVNENGMTTGETWSFTPGLPVAGPGGGNRMEAENMTRSRAFVNTTFTEVPSEIGTVRYTFDKASGYYDVDVRYIDEDDGAGLFELYRNSDLVGSWTADATSWQYRVQTINDVPIHTGDVIKVVSRRHQDELGRVDYVETVFQSPISDTIPPTSSVAALPATTATTSFTVSWSGSDTGGSGLKNYDIYVSIDAGSYTLWQNATTATSATFTGPGGSQYRFYSRARDNAGNLEAAPPEPDAQTQVMVLPGDYNLNGVVDAADYTVWRDALGSTTDLRADGSENGTIDEADYGVWKAHFGQTLSPPGSGTLAGVAVENTAEQAGGGALGTAALIVDDVATEVATPASDANDSTEPVSATPGLARLRLAFAEFRAADDALPRPSPRYLPRVTFDTGRSDDLLLLTLDPDRRSYGPNDGATMHRSTSAQDEALERYDQWEPAGLLQLALGL